MKYAIDKEKLEEVKRFLDSDSDIDWPRVRTLNTILKCLVPLEEECECKTTGWAASVPCRCQTPQQECEQCQGRQVVYVAKARMTNPTIKGEKEKPKHWIAERIKAEYAKHAKNGLPWAEIAAFKIESEVRRKVMEALDSNEDTL